MASLRCTGGRLSLFNPNLITTMILAFVIPDLRELILDIFMF